MNPLAQTDPTSIDELFERDPLSLTESDIDSITTQLVDALRSDREIWEREKAKAKITGKRLSGKATKKEQKAALLEKIKKGGAKIDLSQIVPK